MAKPDCDDGWLRYAHELDAALAAADVTKGGRLVLHEVFAQVFVAKRKAAILSSTEVASRCGSTKQHINRAIRELVGANMLRRDSDGSYQFIKNYELWTRNNQPRFTPTEVAYCRSAPTRAMILRGKNPIDPSTDVVNDSGYPSTDVVNDSGYPSTDVVNDSGYSSKRFRLPEVNDSGYRDSAPPTPPAKESPAQLEKLKNAEKPPSGGGASREDAAAAARNGSIDLAERDRTVDLVRTLFGDSIAAMVEGRAADIHRTLHGRWDCYRAAVRRGKEVRPHSPSGFFIKLGGEYAHDGIPPQYGDDAPKPRTKAERVEQIRRALEGT